MLFKHLDRVRYARTDSLRSELIRNAVGILLHVAIGDVDDEVLVESALEFRSAIDRDYLMAILEYYAHSWRDRERAYLQSTLTRCHVSIFQ